MHWYSTREHFQLVRALFHTHDTYRGLISSGSDQSPQYKYCRSKTLPPGQRSNTKSSSFVPCCTHPLSTGSMGSFAYTRPHKNRKAIASSTCDKRHFMVNLLLHLALLYQKNASEEAFYWKPCVLRATYLCCVRTFRAFTNFKSDFVTLAE